MIIVEQIQILEGGFIVEKKRMGLASKVLIGLVIGVVVGIIVFGLPDGTFKDKILIDGVFQLVGQLFLRSIMMLVVPLVFISLVNGAASMGDIKKLGRVGVKTISFYLVTTAIAIVISLAIAFVINPGVGLDMGSIDTVDVSESQTTPLVQILYEMVPTNPIQALSEGKMLQIIVFAILSGIALSVIGEKGKKVQELFEQLNDLVMRLVNMVMVLAPIGVFGLVARTFGTVGLEALVPILKVVIGVYLGLAIHALVVYGGLFKGFTGLSITKFYKKFYPAMTIAFSTASSNAALPVSMDIAENQLGIGRDVAAFALPLGATINMDGTAIYQGVAAVFIAQVYGVPVTISMAATIVLTATLASIGTAGVPGAGSIMLAMVLQSVGLPLEGLGLILGVDRIFDMGRTAMNITGDAVCTTIIARQEGEFDEELFNSDVPKAKA